MADRPASRRVSSPASVSRWASSWKPRPEHRQQRGRGTTHNPKLSPGYTEHQRGAPERCLSARNPGRPGRRRPGPSAARSHRLAVTEGRTAHVLPASRGSAQLIVGPPATDRNKRVNSPASKSAQNADLVRAEVVRERTSAERILSFRCKQSSVWSCQRRAVGRIDDHQGPDLPIASFPNPCHDPAHRHRWSDWRRHHEHQARQAHQRWNAYADTTT